MNRYIPIVIFPALLMLAACGSGLSGAVQDEQTRFLREKSSEFGAKGVIMFEMRRKAVDSLLGECLGGEDGVNEKIICVTSALRLLEPE